jgi:hypothetical protein
MIEALESAGKGFPVTESICPNRTRRCADQTAQRKSYIDMFKVVFRCPLKTSFLCEPLRRRTGFQSVCGRRDIERKEVSQSSSSSGGPEKTTSPPWIPRTGTHIDNMIGGGMVSSSCSTTRTVLPRSRICSSVVSSR